MLTKQVLLIEISPQLIDFSKLPSGINSEMIWQEAVLANEQLIAAGYDIYNCFIDLGETAEAIVLDLLDKHKFDCIRLNSCFGNGFYKALFYGKEFNCNRRCLSQSVRV